MKRLTIILIFAILLAAAVSMAQENDSTKEEFFGDVIINPTSRIKPGVTTLELTINLPKRFKFVTEAPFQFEVSSDDTSAVRIGSTKTKTPANLVVFPISVKSGPDGSVPDKANLQIDMNLFYCSTGKDAVCYPKLVRLILPVEISENGAEKLTARYTVDPGL